MRWFLRCAVTVIPLLALIGQAEPEDVGDGAAASWIVTRLALKVHLRPDDGSLSARADVALVPDAPGAPGTTIDFFLNRDLALSSVEVNGAGVRWSLDNDLDRTPFAPAARRITVGVPAAMESLEAEEGAGGPGAPAPVWLAVAYEGRLSGDPGSASRIASYLTELNLYAAWFPIFEGAQGFPYEIEVTAPAGYTVVGNGETAGPVEPVPPPLDERASRIGSGAEPYAGDHPGAGESATPQIGAGSVRGEWKQSFRGWSAAGDVPLLALPDLTSPPTSGSGRCRVDLKAADLPEGTASWIASEATWVCGFLVESVGVPSWSSGDLPGAGAPPGGPAFRREGGADRGGVDASRGGAAGSFNMRIVVVPRDGGGYARFPLVVIPAAWFAEGGIGVAPTSDEEEDRMRRLYHEIGHLFSPLADTHTYDDWMNEGLAEHLALLALAARRGPDAAARYVREYLLDIAERSPTLSTQGDSGDRVQAEKAVGGGSGKTSDSRQAATYDRDDQTAAHEGEAAGDGPAAASAAPQDAASVSKGEAPADEKVSQPPAAPEREPVTATILVPGSEAAGALPPISGTRRTDPEAAILYYRKGALIFRMLSGMLGEDRFSEVIRSLRVTYPPAARRRLSTPDLIAAVQTAAGRDLGWVREGFIDRAGLPEIAATLEVKRGAGGRHLVTGHIQQTGPSPFHLLLPLVARGWNAVASTVAEIDGEATDVEWEVPFRPAHVAVDPDLVVPRIDGTVEEALRLLAVATRGVDFTREGLAAERRGDFQTAMERYDRAVAADPEAVLPRYRRARVLAALHELDAALQAHELAGRAAETLARVRARLAPRLSGAAGRGRDGAGEAPPAAWLPVSPDLRCWNWLRIGQIHDLKGERRTARRAYRRALHVPDVYGAHGEARHYLLTPYRPPARPASYPQ